MGRKAEDIRAAVKQDKDSLVLPNKVILLPRKWKRLPDIEDAFVIVPVGTPAGKIYLAPGKSGDAASAASLGYSTYSYAWGAYAPCGGPWWYYYDSAGGSIEAVQLDAPTCCTMLGQLGLFLNVNGFPVTTANPFPVTPTAAVAVANRATMAFGQKVIAVGGTALAIGASQAVPNGFSVAVKALKANVGKVYIGDATVTAANGLELNQTESVRLYMTNVSQIFLNGPNIGDGVSWIVET